jgi:tetrapyrrole methylase family protein / MazG family protein
MENEIKELYNTIKILRSPNGCSWDKKQTSDSLIPYLLEEVHEVIEAIENENESEIKEELGDLLLHLIFQAQIYEEKNSFNFPEVIEQINVKLKNRHPELFGIKSLNNGLTWEEKKQIEKKREKYLDGVPKSLPALTRASRIQEKASQVGFDWKEINPVWEKVNEEITELKLAIEQKNEKNITEEFGDVLFSFVNLARFLKINPETSLKGTINKFESRFHFIETELTKRNIKLSDASLAEMDEIWNKSKKK